MSRSIAALHIAKKQLGLDDETYRAKLSQITGKLSAKDMTEAERQKVLTAFRNDGFKPKATERRYDGRQKLTGKFAPKLQALWIAAFNLGLVENRDDAALIAFVQRQTGISHTRFLAFGQDASKAIEALKAWMAREARVDWSDSRFLPDWSQEDGYRVAKAQAKRLGLSDRAFMAEIGLATGKASFTLSRAEWIKVMNSLGERLREKRKDRL